MSKHDLSRFTGAQENCWKDALTEISNGRKQSHWMWFIFPQIKGLGRTETTLFYGIKDGAEAEAYLAHPVLGARLKEITQALLDTGSTDATAVFGRPDDLKLHSSMTLFAGVTGADPVFEAVLQRFFAGKKDQATLRLLEKQV